VGTGKPGQGDGATPSFYEPGGLAIAGEKLFIADTNNHAIRVVDLKTKETTTLSIRGLQPPPRVETEASEAAPNEEEIQLAPQKLRAGKSEILINIELPAGYHLNPSAPQKYSVRIERGSTSPKQGTTSDMKGRGLGLPVRVPISESAGKATVVASFTFVYCRTDDTGVCRIKTAKWLAPVELTADPDAPAQLNLSIKVPAD
jgi:hypothetical protein